MEFCFPAAPLLIKNLTISSAVAAETFFGGAKERKKLDSWTYNESFVPVRFLEFCKALVDQRHMHIGTGSFCRLTRRRIAAGLAKVSITVVRVRAGGTSVGRFPRAFDL